VFGVTAPAQCIFNHFALCNLHFAIFNVFYVSSFGSLLHAPCAFLYALCSMLYASLPQRLPDLVDDLFNHLLRLTPEHLRLAFQRRHEYIPGLGRGS